MNTSRLLPGLLPSLLAIVVAYSGPLAAQSVSDALLERNGQFEMGDSRPKLIVSRSATKTYHVCMDAGARAVPLSVRHDTKETIVQPGECKLIEASRIKLATVGKLDDRMTLIGTRKTVRRANDLKKYTMEVQIAGQAPVESPGDDLVTSVDR